MTVRRYAELKDPAPPVGTRPLSHRKIHVQDCTDCETREGKVDEITREITLDSDLTRSDASGSSISRTAVRCIAR